MQIPIDGSFVGRMWLEKADRTFLGKGRIELLTRIDETGSIVQAAKAMGMSYRAAWEMLKALNTLADRPVLITNRGGAGGGETRLTDYGREVVQIYGILQAEHESFLRALSTKLQRLNSAEDLGQRFTLRTSARNQYWGRVASVQHQALHSDVALSLGAGDPIVASITYRSVQALDLREGKEACALIKASFVTIAPDSEPDSEGAPNCMRGVVSRIEIGAVNGEVDLQLAAGRTITATVPNERIWSLTLAVGSPAVARVDPSHIILAVND
jgi:molybdate transport system regulatory protein